MMENSNTADINREGAAGKNLFGKNLDIVTSLGARGCLDAEAEGDILYVIGVDRTGVIDPVNFKTSYKTGCLYIVDISVPSMPRITGKLSGLGNTRQIEVKDKIAYVASREDGLFIIDVSDPSSPCLMTHYDTVEFATGIDICGDFAYVSCRVYGVEIIDIAEPGTPLHISTIRMGEAQSVDVRDGVLYAGVWGQQNLTVCDVSDPHNPRITAVMPVDGRADE